MDETKYSILLVDLEASATQKDSMTNAGYGITYDTSVYRSVGSLQVKLPPVGSAMDTKECTIENLPIEGEFLAQLSNNYPFSSISVTVKELDINIDTDVVEDVRTLFKGLVYQSAPAPLKGHMNIVCRGWKYYTDITAGVPCTEQCAWSVLGGRGCGASVTFEAHTVDSISGTDLTLASAPTDTTPFLFNKGYVEFGGSRIKIKYHNTGDTFQLDTPPPSDWVGETVTIYSGCDRQLSTCRDIYNNESQFLGLGIGMVDYNPFIEGA